MPLSDDDLSELEAHYQNDRVGFDILALQRNDKVLGLIAELRAARKVVEAARALIDAKPNIDLYRNLDYYDQPREVDVLVGLEGALAEYDTASAEPQEV